MKQYIILIFLVLLTACSKKINFATSSIVPAANGRVKVKKEQNGNYAITVKVTHLSSPKRLPNPKSNYVVWIETKKNGVRNIGQLKSSNGFLSKTLKASLNTVSVVKPTRVFVTSEDAPDVRRHSDDIILTTRSF